MKTKLNSDRVKVFKFTNNESDLQITNKMNNWINSNKVKIKILNITSNPSIYDSTLVFITYKFI